MLAVEFLLIKFLLSYYSICSKFLVFAVKGRYTNSIIINKFSFEIVEMLLKLKINFGMVKKLNFSNQRENAREGGRVQHVSLNANLIDFSRSKSWLFPFDCKQQKYLCVIFPPNRSSPACSLYYLMHPFPMPMVFYGTFVSMSRPTFIKCNYCTRLIYWVLAIVLMSHEAEEHAHLCKINETK